MRGVPSGIELAWLQLVSGRYGNSVRLAASAFGLDFYVFVSDGLTIHLPVVDTNRCATAQTAAVRRGLPLLPKPWRAPTLQKLKRQLAQQRRSNAQPVRPGVSLLAATPTQASSSDNHADAAQAQQGAAIIEEDVAALDPRSTHAGRAPRRR